MRVIKHHQGIVFAHEKMAKHIAGNFTDIVTFIFNVQREAVVCTYCTYIIYEYLVVCIAIIKLHKSDINVWKNMLL